MKKYLFAFLVAALVFSINSVAFAGPKYKFKMGHPNPADTPYDDTAKKFADLAKEKTNGQVQVTVFPNNQLGDWTETFKLIMRGDVEMGFQCANASYDPKLSFAYYMSYVVRNMEEAKKAYGDCGWALGICKEL
jgi:TRAP-type C4-dicarboxylate transport system substrate-binding protein